MPSETKPTSEMGCARALDPCETSERSGLLAAELNKSCFCITLDRAAMAGAMRTASGDPEFYDAHVVTRPHLFSSVPVFLPNSDRSAMLAVVRAIEETARIPAYRDAVLGWAPEAMPHDFGPIGAMMGYDFHLTDGPPRLIEINTNAGGAFLNAFSARAQQACCTEVEAAKHLAGRALKGGGVADEARIDFIAGHVLNRPLKPEEKSILLASLGELSTYYKDHSEDAKSLLKVGQDKVDPMLDAPSLAAWTMLTNEIMNLDEALNK